MISTKCVRLEPPEGARPFATNKMFLDKKLCCFEMLKIFRKLQSPPTGPGLGNLKNLQEQITFLRPFKVIRREFENSKMNNEGVIPKTKFKIQVRTRGVRKLVF